MAEGQKNTTVDKNELLEKVSALRGDGFRLAQIGCSALGNFEVNYSFDKDYNFVNLKLVVPRDAAEIPSISGVYRSACLYENEIHDLFGIKVNGMLMDYKGNFYRTTIKKPFEGKK